MANTVYETKEIKLQNNEVVLLRPANIKKNREAHRAIEEIMSPKLPSELEEGEEPLEPITNEEYEDLIVNVVQNLLKDQLPEIMDMDYAYEALDEPTMFEVILVMTGIDLKKWLEAIQKMATEIQERMEKESDSLKSTSQD